MGMGIKREGRPIYKVRRGEPGIAERGKEGRMEEKRGRVPSRAREADAASDTEMKRRTSIGRSRERLEMNTTAASKLGWLVLVRSRYEAK